MAHLNKNLGILIELTEYVFLENLGKAYTLKATTVNLIIISLEGLIEREVEQPVNL